MALSSIPGFTLSVQTSAPRIGAKLFSAYSNSSRIAKAWNATGVYQRTIPVGFPWPVLFNCFQVARHSHKLIVRPHWSDKIDSALKIIKEFGVAAKFALNWVPGMPIVVCLCGFADITLHIKHYREAEKFLLDIDQAAGSIKQTKALLRAIYSKKQSSFFVNFLDEDGQEVRKKVRNIYNYADYVARTRSKREGNQFLRTELQNLKDRIENQIRYEKVGGVAAGLKCAGLACFISPLFVIPGSALTVMSAVLYTGIIVNERVSRYYFRNR